MKLAWHAALHRRLSWASMLLCAACACHADGAEMLEPTEIGPARQGLSVSIENDLFGGGPDPTDRWFSNGVHFSLAFDSGEGSVWTRDLVRLGRLLMAAPECSSDRTGCKIDFNAELGQNIYTPRHIEVAQPQVRDRPWAGWLYAGLGMSHRSGNRHQLWSLKLGPTGPASLARETQTYVHRHLTGSPKPEGWQHQLRPRLGAQLGYLSTHRYVLLKTFGLQASWGGAFGNVRSMARAGVGLTWSPSSDVLYHFQPATTDEGEFLVADFSGKPLDGSLLDGLRHIVLFAHVQAAAVAYNAFIEGRTWGPRNDIKRVWDVATTTLGFSIPLGDRGRHKLGFAWKRRSPEFSVRGEVGPDFYQRWGVITWSYDFDPGPPP